MDKGDEGKTDAADDEADGVSGFGILELWQDSRPDNGTDSLYRKEDTDPVARCLKASLAGSVLFHTVSAMAPVE